jgi:hypothetical protein
VAFFRADPRAGFAADAIARIGNGHYLVSQVIAEFVLPFEGFFNRHQYIAPTDLIAPAAADALFYIY